MMNDSANMVLRYYIGFEKTQERFDMLTDFLKRTGIKRVILFSAPFAEGRPFRCATGCVPPQGANAPAAPARGRASAHNRPTERSHKTRRAASAKIR